ncbi:hypothetical protein CROQUDRAFT_98106 [Cronartium quercuum f. sp. fusiforme G11]|uniref:Uncharacterized protein n=1 Tax=Cronartium quercuum f. sp. fusiforme G11 TaxID=708437 RepID=A0A9P6T7J0_9BASI|nr:hypothetical protein CROQUDRAFT_98106 [Cronartium quercuum f. sp. fusiforme G11]
MYHLAQSFCLFFLVTLKSHQAESIVRVGKGFFPSHAHVSSDCPIRNSGPKSAFFGSSKSVARLQISNPSESKRSKNFEKGKGSSDISESGVDKYVLGRLAADQEYVKNVALMQYKNVSVMVIEKSLRTLLKMIRSNVLVKSELQEVLYDILDRNLVNNNVEEAQDRFGNFHLSKFQEAFPDVGSLRIRPIGKHFSVGKSEEEILQKMKYLMISRQLQDTPEVYQRDHRYDSQFPNRRSPILSVIKDAKRQKMNMFDALYEFAITESPVAKRGIPAIISAEEKIFALEACRILVKKFEDLKIQSKTLLKQYANARLSRTTLHSPLNIPTFGTFALQKEFAALYSGADPLQADALLRTVAKALMEMVTETNMWTSNFYIATEQLFYYGKSLIGRDSKTIDEARLKRVINILESLTGPEGVLENHIFAHEALRILKELSGKTLP